MSRFLILSGAFGLLALAACAEYLPVDNAGNTTAAPPKPAEAAATPVKGDQCHAADFQYLVGKPKTEIPVAADLSKRRVYCSTCVVTLDYRPMRLTSSSTPPPTRLPR